MVEEVYKRSLNSGFCETVLRKHGLKLFVMAKYRVEGIWGI